MTPRIRIEAGFSVMPEDQHHLDQRVLADPAVDVAVHPLIIVHYLELLMMVMGVIKRAGYSVLHESTSPPARWETSGYKIPNKR